MQVVPEIDPRNNFWPHTGIFWLRLYEQVERKLEEDPNFLTTPEETKTKELHDAHKTLGRTVGALSDSVPAEAEMIQAYVCRDEPAGVQ
jgi:hypothetical protein